jgi:hypothetical protein
LIFVEQNVHSQENEVGSAGAKKRKENSKSHQILSVLFQFSQVTLPVTVYKFSKPNFFFVSVNAAFPSPKFN